MNRYLLLSCILLLAMTVSCVRAPVERVSWPDDVPSRDYYLTAYSEDDENQAIQSREKYLKWVVRFYKGWRLYQDGWHATTRDVLHGIEDDAKRQRMESKMARLGKLISAEWAKNSDGRRIRSRELSIWGQALLKALNRGEEEQFIDDVTRDTRELLAGRLDPTDISLKRYR